MQFFSDDPRSTRPRHRCDAGPACANHNSFDKVVDDAFELVRPIVLPRVGTPAATKIKRLSVCTRAFARGMHFYGMGKAVWKMCNGHDIDDNASQESSSDDRDEIVGDDPEARKKRGRKAFKWIDSKDSSGVLLCFLAIDSCLQMGHNYLFKHGSVAGVMKKEYTLLKLCDPLQSIFNKVFKLLCDMLSLKSKGWRCLTHIYGYRLRPSVKRIASMGLLAAIGNFWRRFIRKVFNTWDFKLLRVLSLSRADAEDLVKQFLDTDLRLLSIFCKRLRHHFTSVEDYFARGAQDILRIVASTLVCTDHVENMFAHIKQWLLKSMRPPTVACMVANNHNREWRRIWAAKLEGVLVRRNKQIRPAWAYRARTRFTSWNVHVGRVSSSMKRKIDDTVLTEASRSYASEDKPVLKKAASDREAAARACDRLSNELAIELPRATAPMQDNEGFVDNVATPWRLGDRTAPASVTLLQRLKNSKVVADKWAQRCGRLVEPRFVTAGVVPPPAPAKQLLDVQDDAERSALEAWVGIQIENLRLVVAPKCQNTRKVQKLLALHAPAPSEAILIVLAASHLKHPKFTAELVRCEIQDDLTVSCVLAAGVPLLETEEELCYKMASISRGDWRVQEYTYSHEPSEHSDAECDDKLYIYHVVSIDYVDVDELRQREAAREAQNLALRNLKRSLDPKAAIKRGQAARVKRAGTAKAGVKKKPKDGDLGDDEDEDLNVPTDAEDEDASELLPPGTIKEWKEADKKSSKIVSGEASASSSEAPYAGLEWVFGDHLRFNGGALAGRLKLMPSGDYYISCRQAGHAKCVVWCNNKKVANGKMKALKWLSEREHIDTCAHKKRWLQIRDEVS